MGVFARIITGLTAERTETKTIMIDAASLKAHRTDSSLRLKKWGCDRLVARTEGDMNTKLHAVTDSNGRPINFFMSGGLVG